MRLLGYSLSLLLVWLWLRTHRHTWYVKQFHYWKAKHVAWVRTTEERRASYIEGAKLIYVETGDIDWLQERVVILLRQRAESIP